MLGIYGGTFDPIHHGHLRTALEVKEALQLEELRLLPCRLPPHRGSPGCTPQQRLKMLELALEHAEPGFVLDRRELERDGPSYMVDTLASIREEIGDRPLCLIVGLDAFAGFPSWHRWRELLELAHVAVMRRPDAPAPEWAGELTRVVADRKVEGADVLRQSSAGRIAFLDVTQLAISATGIRRLIAAGKSPRYLVPDAVWAMIQSQRLYR